jgi:hypothetical protein
MDAARRLEAMRSGDQDVMAGVAHGVLEHMIALRPLEVLDAAAAPEVEFRIVQKAVRSVEDFHRMIFRVVAEPGRAFRTVR